jgi:hypothetical protein
LQYSYCVSVNTLTMTPQSETPKTTRGTIALRKLATDQQQPTP